MSDYSYTIIYVRYILVWGRMSADYYKCTFYDIRVHIHHVYSCSDIRAPMNRCRLKSTNK